MSQATGLGTRTIFIPLLDEGTGVLRPTSGVILGEGTYRVPATPTYEIDDEHWKFPPHSVVRCMLEKNGGEEILVARELAPALK